MNSASDHLNRRRPSQRLRALRALASASVLGYTGAHDLPHWRFVRAGDRAASATTLPSTLVASPASGSRARFDLSTPFMARLQLLHRASCNIESPQRLPVPPALLHSRSYALRPNPTVNRTRRFMP
jgi:hypothetical protein